MLTVKVLPAQSVKLGDAAAPVASSGTAMILSIVLSASVADVAPSFGTELVAIAAQINPAAARSPTASTTIAISSSIRLKPRQEVLGTMDSV